MSDASMKTNPSCPSAQSLARFAAGRAEKEEIAALMKHLDGCSDCRDAVATAAEFVEAEEARDSASTSTGPRWLVAAAVVLAAALGVFAVWRLGPWSERGTTRLVALTRGDRIVEPRLSGGFEWAPYRGPARAADDADVERMKLVGAAGEAAERARRDPSAETQQTAGVAMLLVQRPDDAVALLAQAAKAAPDDARLWSDLAAAQLVAATQYGRASLYAQALASADSALRIDPAAAEALFNRALILERMGLHDAAQAAWQRYLEIDASSEWAKEARAHLRRPAADVNERYQRDVPRLDPAALAHAYPQQSRTFAETVHLGDWGAAEQRGDAAAAAHRLALARAIGNALAGRGETLLRDAVAAIDVAPAGRRASLAAAHVTYVRARRLYSRQQPTEAEALLREAAAGFAHGGSPMALVARYYAANAQFDRQQTEGARAELSALLEVFDARAEYAALRAQVRWQLALCAMVGGAWSEALPLLREAEEIFVRRGENGHAANVGSLLATTLLGGGQSDEGWASRIRAFDALSRDGARGRLLVAIGAAVRMELRARRLESARALLQIEEKLCREERNDVMTADALLRHAVLSEELGDHASAAALVEDAAATASRIADAPLRGRAEADVAFARGAVLLESDPRRARELLSRAIAAYASVQYAAFLPEAYLLRARAAQEAGDGAGAAADLARGVAELEQQPVADGNVVGTGVLDAGRRLYEDAIRLHLARGDEEGAFIYAERARSPRDVRVDALRERLAGTDTAVLELVAAGGELIAFCLTERGLDVARSPFDAARLAAMSDEERYDLLVRPSAEALRGARRLVVVAGGPLRNVAFGALRDGAAGPRLIERMPVVFAPTASALRTSSATRPSSVLAVALPSGDRESIALPDSRAEIAEVAGAYASARVLEPEQATAGSFAAAAGDADVIHIAGHTDGAAGELAFVFARGERVSPERVAALAGVEGVVVLAACNTLRTETQSATLGDAFLAAGARAVVGTLQPIADRDARSLFAAFHRALASGLDEAEALRRVQVEAIASGDGRAWASLSLLTTSLPPASRRIR